MLNLGAGLATTAISYYFARKGKYTKTSLKSELMMTGSLLPLSWQYLKLINSFSNPLVGTLVGTAIGQLAFPPVIWGLRYLFNNYSLKSAIRNFYKLPSEIFSKGIKPNYKESVKRGWKFGLINVPLNYAIWTYFPIQYQYPIMQTKAIFNRIFRGRLELEQAERTGVIKTEEKYKDKKTDYKA